MPSPPPSDVESVAHLFHGLAHPLRLRVLLTLDSGVLSPHELAQLLDVPLGVVAYHVRTLRDEQLVELVETRMARGSIASFYRLTGRGQFARALLAETWPGLSDRAAHPRLA